MALEINDQFQFFQNVKLDDDGNLLVSIVNGISTFTGGTIDNLTVTGNTIVGSFSAGTIYSGGTNLYDIFLTSNDGNDITRIQPGRNIITGGTANEPIVSLAESISINDLTFSGTVIGGTVQAGAGTFTSLSSATLSAQTIVSNDLNIENLYITSGATGGYVWTSVDSTGRGYWAQQSGGTDLNYYTTAATLSGTIITFDRNDLADAYSVDLSGITVTGDYLPISGGTLTGNLNIDGDLSVSGLTSNYIIGGDANGYDYTIDGGDANFPIFTDYGELFPAISTGQTTYTFSEPANVLSISILTGSTTVILPQYPASRQYIVKDKTGNAALFPITVSATNVTINGETEYIINLGSKPSITFLFDGIEYITI